MDRSAAVDGIEVDARGPVLWIRINRPALMNAIGPPQRIPMLEALTYAGRSLAVRAVVITGTGSAFCSGADLSAGAVAGEDPPPGAPAQPFGGVARSLRDGAQRLTTAVIECDKPVIAAVNGTAAGVGAHLALACDLVLAADTARFIEVFARRGLVPDAGGAWLLPRLIGLQRAKELVFFGDDVGALDAERLGLVNRVVPAEDLEATATDWSERLAAGPTTALGLAKRLLNRSFESNLATSMNDEAQAVEINKRTNDAGEGISSFKERRPPNFKGW